MTARRRLTGVLRNKFIAGLLILIPIVLTAKALWWLFTYIDGLAGPLALKIIGRPVPGIGFVTTIVVVFLAGLLFSAGPLKRVLEAVEAVLDAVPVVGSVYGTSKKVLSGFGGPDSQHAFKRFVFARLPGRTTPGFLTGTFTMRMKDDRVFSLCTVYVPTNHLYVGDVVVLPVEDGVSIILSAGAAIPEHVVEK